MEGCPANPIYCKNHGKCETMMGLQFSVPSVQDFGILNGRLENKKEEEVKGWD